MSAEPVPAWRGTRSRASGAGDAPVSLTGERPALPPRAPARSLGERALALLPIAALLEIASVMALFVAYNLGRLVATSREHVADTNAWTLVDWQQRLRLPSEEMLQGWALEVPHVVGLGDRYYLVHFPVTVAVLVWLYWRDRTTYRWAKRALVLATGVAMVVHLVLPMTPPRLLSGLGVLDTAHRAGTSVYAGSPVSGLANEYAAMPSLHVGWALLLAVVLVTTSTNRWRWWWLAHPVLTLVTVVVTGNHYLMDAAAGSLLVLAALVLTRRTLRGAPCAAPPGRADG